ncbi:hypothetical protein JCM13580A_17080 [Streptomyces drozdowiczii]
MAPEPDAESSELPQPASAVTPSAAATAATAAFWVVLMCDSSWSDQEETRPCPHTGRSRKRAGRNSLSMVRTSYPE